MPLPAGFKVNGTKTRTENQVPVPPRVKKIIIMLNALPANELITTMELSGRLGLSLSGAFMNHPVLIPFREKVDNKLFWGNRKSITQLQAQLVKSEENPSEN
jgi:hypothetical protein